MLFNDFTHHLLPFVLNLINITIFFKLFIFENDIWKLNLQKLNVRVSKFYELYISHKSYQ